MPARRKHIPKELLEELYLEQGLSPREIGARIGCGETAIRRRLQECSIPVRSRSQAIRLAKGVELSRDTLLELYRDRSMSVSEIATRLGCSEETVRSRMDEHGIPRRTPAEIARLTRGIDLSEAQAREWYEGQRLSIPAIAKRLGCSETAVRNRLIEYGIERREPWAHNIVDLGKEKLRHLYEEEGLSVEVIAEFCGCSPATVSRKMAKHSIAARPPWRVKYPRHDFDGSPSDKAYLIGFRLGDLTVRRAELSVEVLGTTTRQEQVDLIHDLFDRYGHVYEHRRSDGRVFLQARLNNTFDFLLAKEDRVPDWVSADEEAFFGFLAGYVDADGSIRVVGPHSARLDIQTYDKGIQQGIWTGLADRGIHCPQPRVVVKAGWTNSLGIVQRQDKWGMWVHRRRQLLRLLHRLIPYLRHYKRRRDALAAQSVLEAE